MPDPLILVVDDSPDVLAAISAVLGHSGFRVATAPNGAVALSEIDREMPALVLLDIQMPVMNGMELMAALEERGLRIPVIIMSDGAAEKYALETGVVSYINKPFHLARLLAIIEVMLRAA